MTQKIHFDENGQRDEFYVEVLEFSQRNGFQKIATWDQTSGVNLTRTFSDLEVQLIESSQNKTFKILMRLAPPFLFLKYVYLSLYLHLHHEEFPQRVHSLALTIFNSFLTAVMTQHLQEMICTEASRKILLKRWSLIWVENTVLKLWKVSVKSIRIRINGMDWLVNYN